MESGVEGTVISMETTVDQEWDDHYDCITTKTDDKMWISVKHHYIKRSGEGLKKLERLDELHQLYQERHMRNLERIKIAKERLKKQMRKRIKKASEQQYKENLGYKLKVNSMMLYAIMSRTLYHSMFINHKHSGLKAGLYLTCLTLSRILEETKFFKLDSIV